MEKGRYYYQVVLWNIYYFFHIFLIGTTVGILLILKPLNEKGQLFIAFLALTLICTAFVISRYFYKKKIFSLKELQNLYKKFDVQILSIQRKYIEILGPFPKPFGYLIKGQMNNILIYAVLEKPFNTYFTAPLDNILHQRRHSMKFERWNNYYFGGSKSNDVKYFIKPYIIMDHTSRVNLFHLFADSPYDIDFEIKYNAAEKPNINTKCPEINQVVSNFLQEIDYFHWRIIFNDTWLRLMIIGGAWQGGMFGRNIENGINCFKELVARLEGKYPVQDWRGWDIKWDKNIWDFVLVKAEHNEAGKA